MSHFITATLLLVGTALLAIALKPAAIALRNSIYRIYISFRPQRVMDLLSAYYPYLDLQLSRQASLTFIPVPWTVIEAILYATEQSQRLSRVITPALQQRTTLVNTGAGHGRAVADFNRLPMVDEEARETIRSTIRALRKPASRQAEDQLTREDLAASEKRALQAVHSTVRNHVFVHPFESEFRRMEQYLKGPLDARDMGQRIIDAIITQRNGGEEVRRYLTDRLNQFIVEKYGAEQDE